MIIIILVSNRKETLFDFAAGLEKDDIRLFWAGSGNEALSTLSDNVPGLVIADEDLGDMTGLEFIKELVAVNPMINCAAVSSLSPDDFHEASEGLGILMQLPEKPGKEDGVKLLEHLSTIIYLIKKVN